MRIPASYAYSTFENFDVTESSRKAAFLARRFVDLYSPIRMGQDGPTGLLLTGTVGTGKTHLASATLRLLVLSAAIWGRFVDCRELFELLRESYDDHGPSQRQILAPILAADAVVLDDLGSTHPSPWVNDTTELVIGSLYNRQKSIIVTTNFPNYPAGGAPVQRTDTLGDRIGARMWSRLQQMCVAVDMSGPDWRMNHR